MLEKLFNRKKKAKEKPVRNFWKDFEERIDLYLNIISGDEEDSDDYLWMLGLIRKGLKMCCLDSTVGFDFRIEKGRDPIRFVFVHGNDAYLKDVGALLEANYPASLSGKIQFAAAEL